MRKRHVVVGAVVLALVAVACGSGATGTKTQSSGGVKEGGVFRLGTSSGIDSLNPFVAFQQDAYAAFEYIYPTLVQYDAHLNFVGDFATSWEYSADGKTWTFHTRPNAKWSDGQPLTAADVAWNINTILKYQKGATANAAGYVSHITSAEATDPNTLVVNYDAAVANVLSQFQQFFVIPEHIWSQHLGHGGADLKTFDNAAPVVSGGPFILKSFQKGQTALFEQNPSYYGPKPHIQGFGLQFFTNDDAMITALKSGELDGVETVPPTNVKTLQDAGFVVKSVPGVEFHDLIINSNPKKTTNVELLDPNVKKAFEYAIDRNKIVSVARLGFAQPGDSIVPPATGIWHDPNLKPIPFDLNAANQLLDQAGFAKGSDGIRVAHGHPMAYTVIFAHDEAGPGDRAFQIIQADFQQIGVKLTQRALDDSAAFDAITAPGTTGYLNFDLAMWDWVPLIDPDFILSVVTCGQYGGWSDSGYCNAQYDQWYKEQSTLTKQSDRVALVYQMQDQIYNDRPYIVLNYDDQIEAHTKNWTGFVYSPQGSFNPLSKATMTEIHQV